MLIAWPLVAAGLFSRFAADRAAVLTIVLGYLLLPSGTGFDVPLLPPFDKSTIPPLSALLFCLVKGSGGPGLARLNLASLALAIVLVGSPLITGLNNAYAMRYGTLTVQPFTWLDGAKTAANHLIMLSSFYIGYRYVSGQRSQRSLLVILVGAGLLYSLPALLEVRLSPQLHTWIYGFFPHSFIQMRRGDGFRPLVFLEHGLHVALFFALCIIGAVALRRAQPRILNLPTGGAAIYLGVVLVACKSLGALVYAASLAPLVMACRPRVWATVASVLALVVCAYPLLRTQSLIPVNVVQVAASGVSEDRASSFEFRLINEEMLLHKAAEKPLFGWGLQGRNLVYGETDGALESIPDGAWILAIGQFGWVGYTALFGLLAVSIVRLRGAIRRLGSDEQAVAGGLSLVLTANLVDLIPNANITPVTWLIAGSLAGTGLARAARRPPRGSSGLRAGQRMPTKPDEATRHVAERGQTRQSARGAAPGSDFATGDRCRSGELVERRAPTGAPGAR